MLLATDTLELCPAGPEVVELLSGDPRFKLELPASQIEITTPPSHDVPAVAAALLDARRALVEASAGVVRSAAAGVHPFSPGVGELNRLPAYERTVRDFGRVARRQLVCALQVHVAAGNADRCLAVYNAARSYLPLIAALAANAPFYEGHDTGLASVRPKLGGLLPRQGVPPVIESWEAYSEILGWASLRARSPPPRRGGGSCGCTQRSGRWSSECPTGRVMSTTPLPSLQSSRRWSSGSASAMIAASSWRFTQAGRSTRTDGRHVGTAWRATWSSLRKRCGVPRARS